MDQDDISLSSNDKAEQQNTTDSTKFVELSSTSATEPTESTTSNKIKIETEVIGSSTVNDVSSSSTASVTTIDDTQKKSLCEQTDSGNISPNENTSR